MNLIGLISHDPCETLMRALGHHSLQPCLHCVRQESMAWANGHTSQWNVACWGLMSSLRSSRTSTLHRRTVVLSCTWHRSTTRPSFPCAWVRICDNMHKGVGLRYMRHGSVRNNSAMLLLGKFNVRVCKISTGFDGCLCVNMPSCIWFCFK